MKITLNRNENELTAVIEGRLDTLASPELEETLEPELEECEGSYRKRSSYKILIQLMR
jgi:anti-sigma B factor antagonist